MGYSIYVLVNKKDHQKATNIIEKYLESNFYPLFREEELYVSFQNEIEHIAYKNNEHKNSKAIGFNYSPGTIQRKFIYFILYWVALKFGRKYKGESYYWYDGYERTIVTEETFKNQMEKDIAELKILYEDEISIDFNKELKKLNELYDLKE